MKNAVHLDVSNYLTCPSRTCFINVRWFVHTYILKIICIITTYVTNLVEEIFRERHL